MGAPVLRSDDLILFCLLISRIMKSVNLVTTRKGRGTQRSPGFDFQRDLDFLNPKEISFD